MLVFFCYTITIVSKRCLLPTTTSENWRMYQRIQETPKQFQRSAGIAPAKGKQCK